MEPQTNAQRVIHVARLRNVLSRHNIVVTDSATVEINGVVYDLSAVDPNDAVIALVLFAQEKEFETGRKYGKDEIRSQFCALLGIEGDGK